MNSDDYRIFFQRMAGIIFRRLPRFSFLILLLSLAFLYFARPVNFVTADLGRHLQNGRLFWQEHVIPAVNFYSYTQPGFPAVCHHWFSGVVFQAVLDRVGLGGLSVFYVVLLCLSLLIYILSAVRQGRWAWSFLAALFVLPLLGYRVEIRPEGFSTLFLALYFFILNEYRRGFLSWKVLLVLLFLQVAWVNVHVFFVVGIGLTGCFALDSFFMEGVRKKFKVLTGLTAGLIAVSFLNPFGAAGVVHSFDISKAYGYSLAENQSVFFMLRRFPQEIFFSYFLCVLGVLCLVLILHASIVRDWRKIFLPLILVLFFGFAALKAVRGIAIFGFVFIPVFSWFMEDIAARISVVSKRWLRRGARGLSVILLFFGLVVPDSFFSPLKRVVPLLKEKDMIYQRSFFQVLARPYTWMNGLPGISASADFWKARNLRGPVFNNYDIGAYLVFFLFPQERVFVDNRPEAYSSDFFKKTYVPMQEDEAVWRQENERYGFQAIYFYRLDITPWAQPFLIRRLSDLEWAPVFVDAYTIILLRRGGVNQPVISAYELPKNIFRIVKD